MSKYKHLFFDLDRTLWDFETSARQTFEEMYQNFDLQKLGVTSYKDFTKKYKEHNDLLWTFYRKGKIKKEVLSVRRFEMTLDEFGIDNYELAQELGRFYITESPLKVNLFPYTHEVLNYLRQKYHLHMITNGFEEVQQTKIDQADLRKYFREIITSEEAGVKKPEKGIFRFAFEKTGTSADEALMIGDDLEVDIKGAQSVGMDQMFVNYNGIVHQNNISYEVASLKEIEEIL